MQIGYAGNPCPKCGYVRAAAETAPDWQCPNCGIAYLKYVEAQQKPQRHIDGRTSSGRDVAGFDLTAHREVLITQKSEVVQLLPVETKTPYRISGTAGKPMGYAAKQGGSSLEFELHFFNLLGKTVFHALNVAPALGSSYCLIYDSQKLGIGAIRSMRSLLTTKFSIENGHGDTIMEVESPVWGLSPLVFTTDGKKVASVRSESSGGILSIIFKAFSEVRVEFHANSLDNDRRILVLATALYVPVIEAIRRSRY